MDEIKPALKQIDHSEKRNRPVRKTIFCNFEQSEF